MTLDFLFEKWCHSYSHWPLTDHLLNTRNFVSCWVTSYRSWSQWINYSWGNKQKTSGNFSDSQKSDKFYLEYNAVLQPIHFLNIELSSSQPKNIGSRGQGPGPFIVLCKYSVKVGKFLSPLLLSSISFRKGKNASSYLIWVTELKHLPLACSSPDSPCISDKCHHLGKSYALSSLRMVVLNCLTLE